MDKENSQCQSCLTHQSDESQLRSPIDAGDENYFFDDTQTVNEADPLAPCISAARADLLARIFLGFAAAAIAWHEIGGLMPVLAFLYVYFFAPRMSSQKLYLKSGRRVKEVRPVLTRWLISGPNAGKKSLDVYYTCCTDNVNSKLFQREFEEMIVAVLQSSKHRKLRFAEITALLPVKKTFFPLTNIAPVARSAQFVLDLDCWRPVEVPLVPEST